jgi:L-threonylcarbamoyladenylate synthase
MEKPTRLINIDPAHPDPSVLAEAAETIRAGGLVAFPTETVYGLGANALDAAAVAGIFVAKERPAHDPIIVHIAEAGDLARLAVEVPPVAVTLAERFWPGPLTLVLARQPVVPDVVTAGGPTVAVRFPAHPLAQALIRAAGTPIAAPSANRFSRTSPTTARHVWDDLAGRIDMILDGGPTQVGVESTVLDLTTSPPTLLRPGGVTIEAIEARIGAINRRARQTQGAALPSPGMLERHYAPQAVLWLFTGEDAAIHYAMRSVAKRLIVAGHRIGLLLADEDRAYLEDLDAEHVYLGSRDDPVTVARNLFNAMRALDATGVEAILARDFPDEGLGSAIRDRLRRAAGQIMEAGEGKEN